MREKSVLTYIVRDAVVRDTIRRQEICVRYARHVDPAEYLLSASKYDEASILHAHKKVAAARKLGVKCWYGLEYGDSAELTFTFQGNSERDDWYHVDVSGDLTEGAAKLLARIVKAMMPGGTLKYQPPSNLTAVLDAMKAVRVTWDKYEGLDELYPVAAERKAAA